MSKVADKLEYCLLYGTMGGRDCRLSKRAVDECPNKNCQTGCSVTTIKEAVEILRSISKIDVGKLEELAHHIYFEEDVIIEDYDELGKTIDVLKACQNARRTNS